MLRRTPVRCLGADLSEALAAYRLIAGLSLTAAKVAALVHKELDLLLFRTGQSFEILKIPVQPKVRDDKCVLRSLDLRFQICKVRQDLRCGRNKVELRIMLRKVSRQKIRTRDDAVAAAALRKDLTEPVAERIGKVGRGKEQVAEGKTRGNPVRFRERQNVPYGHISLSHSAASPEAPRRGAVEGADGAPVVEVLPV